MYKPKPEVKLEPKPAPVIYKLPVESHSDINTYSSYNCRCFDGKGVIELKNGMKKVKDLVKNDEVICPEGKIVKVVALIVIKVNVTTELVELNGVKLTVKHPVRVNEE